MRGIRYCATSAWLRLFPTTRFGSLTSPADLASIAAQAEAGGNPVIPAVALMRARLEEPAANWLHRGLTSQDVLDTALVLLVRDLLDEHGRAIQAQVSGLADTRRASP